VVGLSFEVSEAALAVLFAFLAGGVIMNVLKEELPEERESRFWAFALGAALYSVVLLVASRRDPP
jgi:zinc transporter ZupT